MKWLKALIEPLLVGVLISLSAGAGAYLAVMKLGAGFAAEAKGALADTRTVLKSTSALVDDAKASIDDNYYDVKATVGTVATAARDSDDLIHDLRSSLVGGVDTQGKQRDGLIVQATLLLGDSRELVVSMRADLGKLTDSADGALKPLGTALDNIATLSATLNKEIQADSPKVAVTVEALGKSVADLDKIISDPDIQKILANSADTTKSISESAASLDAVTRPWRKKVGQLQLILKTLASFLKVTIPLPF